MDPARKPLSWWAYRRSSQESTVARASFSGGTSVIFRFTLSARLTCLDIKSFIRNELLNKIIYAGGLLPEAYTYEQV